MDNTIANTEIPVQKYQAGFGIASAPFVTERSMEWNPFSPFLNLRDYKLARFLHSQAISKSGITELFKDDKIIPDRRDSMQPISFYSSHTFQRQTDRMIDEPSWRNGNAKFPFQPTTVFYYRDILACMKYLLRQRAYAESLVWSPVKNFNTAGERLYSEMNTGTWWWDTQV